MAKMTLKLPKVAVSMQEGSVAEWFVADGAEITVGQRLYALETEKTTMEMESPFAGRITLIGRTGTVYPVGTPIAEIET